MNYLRRFFFLRHPLKAICICINKPTNLIGHILRIIRMLFLIAIRVRLTFFNFKMAQRIPKRQIFFKKNWLTWIIAIYAVLSRPLKCNRPELVQIFVWPLILDKVKKTFLL